MILADFNENGIALDKGVVLTRDFLDTNAAFLKRQLEFWMQYPDAFLDSIQASTDVHFHLMPFQRIALRASVRYRYHSWTATRATSKSFTAYLAAYLICTFRENSTIQLVSDTKEMVVKIAKAKFDEIFRHWPLLQGELKTMSDDGEKGKKGGSDYFELNFKNGSKLQVVSIDKRGLRATGSVVEESATVEEIDYNEVVVPTMNVPRRDAAGAVNPTEPTSPQIFITTAATKSCFFYGKLIEMTINAVLHPDDFYIWGSTYEIPVHYGLLNETYIKEQKYSSTYSAESFARESLSIWTGANSNAWFDEKMLLRRRTLLKCEREAATNLGEDFYIIACDVGRYKCNTAITVLRVHPTPSGGFRKKVVYLEAMTGENFITQQAPRIKTLIERYCPREVVMDGNGLTNN